MLIPIGQQWLAVILYRWEIYHFSRFCVSPGVDFQVKTMSVKGNSVAIQLWDTAGQERFRSITRHYFRKADAVIVVYDVTSEKSFLSLRNWMTSIEVSFRCNCWL